MKMIRLSAKERTNLRHALRSHPDVLSQVKKLSDISALDKASLLEAAQALGIDIEDAKAGDYASHPSWDSIEGTAQRRRSDEKPAFVGSLEDQMTFVLLGKSITRTLRVTYELTPAWPYVDADTGEEMQGWGQSTMRYDFLVRREVGLIGSRPEGRSRQRTDREEWVNCTNLFMHELLGAQFDEAIDCKIEEACLRENQARRELHSETGPGKVVWIFKVGDYKVVCREEEATFVDPLVHEGSYENLRSGFESGAIDLTHMTATVFRHDCRIGRGTRRDCVRKSLDYSELLMDSEEWEAQSRIHSDTGITFRNQAVRRAIADARASLK